MPLVLVHPVVHALGRIALSSRALLRSDGRAEPSPALPLFAHYRKLTFVSWASCTAPAQRSVSCSRCTRRWTLNPHAVSPVRNIRLLRGIRISADHPDAVREVPALLTREAHDVRGIGIIGADANDDRVGGGQDADDGPSRGPASLVWLDLHQLDRVSTGPRGLVQTTVGTDAIRRHAGTEPGSDEWRCAGLRQRILRTGYSKCGDQCCHGRWNRRTKSAHRGVSCFVRRQRGQGAGSRIRSTGWPPTFSSGR